MYTVTFDLKRIKDGFEEIVVQTKPIANLTLRDILQILKEIERKIDKLPFIVTFDVQSVKLV